MKSLKLSALALTLTASMMSMSAQAEQKIGVVNVQAIFQGLPQAATVQQTITAEFKDEIEVVNRLEKDLQYYLEKQKRDTATMSQAEITELEGKINSLREEYAAKAQPLQQNTQRRLGEERNKLLALISQGINTVAEKGNYDMVLNANAITYVKPENDISTKVLEELTKSESGN